MQIKVPFKPIILVLTLSSGTALSEPNSLVYDLGPNGITIGPEHQKIDSLPGKERDQIVRSIRHLLDSPDVGDRYKAADALLFINDQQAIKHIISLYRANIDSSSYSFTYIEEAGRGAVIPYLIPDIYNDHGKTIFVSERPQRFRYYSAYLILRCIMRSPEFPERTRAWAKNIDFDLSFEAAFPLAINQMKAWWEHNKDAILAGEYSKATWIPSQKIDLKKLTGIDIK